MIIKSLIIRHLTIIGEKVRPAVLDFDKGCNLVWGASNTGKSFTLEALDFMFGGSSPLPDINERRGYQSIWLGISIIGAGDFTLSRSISGGAFSLYTGLFKGVPTDQSPSILSQKHDNTRDNNLSSFLLSHLGFDGKFVAKDTFGEKHNLSFRHLAHILLANETLIQSKHSPIQGGDRSDKVLERSVFRLLLSGSDDSAISPVENPKKTKTFKAIKMEMLDSMISEIDARLNIDYSDAEDLLTKDTDLTEMLSAIQAEFDAAQGSIRNLLNKKQKLTSEISMHGARLDEIEVHLGRFSQLDRVYASDIARLEALEEAGFLVSLGKGNACELCGADPEAQKHPQGIADAEQVRSAAIAEIAKIRRLRLDLSVAVGEIHEEQLRLKTEFPKLTDRLVEIERDMAELLPKADASRLSLGEILAARDRVRAGLALIDQKRSFLERRAEAEKIKSISKKDKPNLNIAGTLVHDFCQVVSRVLTAWEFPGELHVAFDEKSYDLRIDGKLRIDNGKGVRAVTHGAFKIALLIFCREHELPHPGIVVLDTPLLTYRDPIKNPKHGKLTADEKALASTQLKAKFFEHLHSIKHLGQFIILENVDLPENIDTLAKVEIFSGSAVGRVGLFPVPI